MQASRYRVSADIGGTFTDFVVLEASSGKAFTGKLRSTPGSPDRAVLEGVHRLVPDPRAIEFLVHGTTVGINAFLQRNGARVLLVTTAGFRDSYTIARGDRTELYRLQYRKPRRLVPRRDVHEVRERIKADGSILEPLHTEDFAPIIQKVTAEKIPAVAVCLLHAYAHPRHELEAREILLRALPGVSVTLSHEIAREWREYERASTAVINAYIAPIVDNYLRGLIREIRALGVPSQVYVMQSSGGIMTAQTAARQPIRTLLSGPVGGTVGATALARAAAKPRLVCVDMGGTSFDMSLVVDGKPTVASATHLEGLPLLTPIVDVHTIGAGGGSVAWVEAGGLRVGPHSAGAEPGPACYGRGGTEPTVTDAHLFLGRLGPRSLLGGQMTLDEGAAARAIAAVAAKLAMDEVALAEGMLAVINGRMADAMRTITVACGIDPRDYSLLAFGGAGPMHAVWLAEELAMREVIVPVSPGTFSAAGMLQTDVRHDLARSYYRPLAGTDPRQTEAAFLLLIEEGREALRAEGVALEDMLFELACDMRYVGQEYTVNVRVEIEPGRKDAPGTAGPEEMERAFHAAYLARYGHAIPAAPVEIVTLRVAAVGLVKTKLTRFTPAAERRDPMTGVRTAVFAGERLETAVLDRRWMAAGSRYEGPLVVEEESATTVVPPRHLCRVDPMGNLVITRSEVS